MKALQWIKSLFKRKESKETPLKLKLIFTDRKGKKWYSFENPQTLSVQRSIYCENAIGRANFGLSEQRIENFLDLLVKCIKNNEVETMVYAIAEIRSYNKQIAEYETLMLLAAAFVLEENEDINDLTFQTANKKIDYWEKDSECIDFFLHFAFSHTENFGKHSSLNITNYLTSIKKIPGQRNLRPNQK